MGHIPLPGKHRIEKALFFIMLSIGLACIIGACSNKVESPGFIPPMPPVTQTGANTFGGYINGNAFVAYQHNFEFLPRLSAQYSNGTLFINAQDDDDAFGGSVYIDLYNITYKGTYALGEQFVSGTFGHNNGEIVVHGEGIKGVYTTDTLNTGTVTITRFDTDNHIVSGTFHMAAGLDTANVSKTVTMSSGRFDVTYSVVQ